jgi:hypothetical protein
VRSSIMAGCVSFIASCITDYCDEADQIRIV